MKSIITDFGAVGDNVTDDTAAFQAAINSGLEVYIDTPPASYKITGTLTINAPVSLIGARNKSSISPTFAGNLFTIRSGDVNISGLKVFATAGLGTNLVLLDTNITADIERVRIEDVDGWNLNTGIADSGGAGQVITLTLRDIMFRLHLGYGLYFTKVYAFLLVDTITVDSVGVNNNTPKIVVENNAGCYFSRIFLLGSTPSNGSQYGFYFQNSQAIHLSTCHADTLGGIAYYFNTCEYIQADHITASLVNNHGLYMYHTTIAQVTNLYCGGRTGLSPAIAGCNGIYLDAGCDRINIDNYTTRLNTGIQEYNNPANTNIVLTAGIVT